MNYELVLALFTLLLIPGVLMSLFPVLPGMLYMFFVALVFATVDSFVHFSAVDLIVLACIVALAMIADFVAGFIGAKRGGANNKSLLAGMFGLVIGTFMIPVPVLGSFVGFFLGIFCGEIFQHRSKAHAIKAATGGLIGSIVGSITNIIAAIAFVILFVIFALY